MSALPMAAPPLDAEHQEAAAALLEALPDAVWLVDAAELKLRWCNAASSRLLRMPSSALVDCQVTDLCTTPEDFAFWAEVAAGLADHIDSHTRLRRADGAMLPVWRLVKPVRWRGASAYLVLLRDLGEQQQVETELEERAAELASTLESIADGILVTDAQGRIRSFNQKFVALWELPPSVIARHDDEQILALMRRRLHAPAGSPCLPGAAPVGAEPCSDSLALADGRVIERVSRAQFHRGRQVGLVHSFRDITERVEAIRRIDSLSHTDALTGLANRQVLMDRIAFALALERRESTPCALLRVDLDRFKHINDTLGHTIGDRVLIEVAVRLGRCLREVDQVARLGSDDFVLLLHQADEAVAEAAARRVLAVMAQPFDTDGLHFTVTCSIGIALHRPGGDTPDELLRRAGIALQEVKLNGRAHFRFQDAADGPGDAEPRHRLQLDHAMRLALPAGRFRLHYQPQVDIRSGQVHGAEALIRWTDPELGEVSPGRFIPVAEDSGFIVSIGDWVLREAVSQAARWYGEGADLIVSVNVSPLQFQQPDFVEGVARVLRDAGLPGERLELELTESLLIHNAEATLLRLNALAALGIRLAIDDFGTGYSSLGYLKRFPIARLKIDRSFVSGLPSDESDAGIVQAIVQLGRALHLQVIAEGVETEGQRAFLQGIGAQEYQGFLFAPALEVGDFSRLLSLRPGVIPPAPAPLQLLRVK